MLNHVSVESFGLLMAFVVWGFFGALALWVLAKDQVKQALGAARHSPFRALLAVAAIGILTAYAQKPKPTVVTIAEPEAEEELVYSGSALNGFKSIDSRLIVSGSTNETAAGSYEATFALPDDTATETYQWAGGGKADCAVPWGIAARDVTDAAVLFDAIPDQTHTGAPIKPTVTMTFAGVVRSVGTDYSVSYSDNINVGTAHATVTGQGNFTGSKMLDFVIKAADPGKSVVTFDATGGSVTETTREVVNGAAIGKLPEATRKGYDFLGWFTTAEGEEEVTAEYIVESDATVYAQWTIQPGTILPGYVGQSLSYSLEELGVEASGALTVKIEGLAKGLKYKDLSIKGVPTEELDFATQPMYARVTTKIGTLKIETLQPVRLQIVANCLYTDTLGEEIERELGEGIKSASGLPKGLKYKDGTVSGTPTKTGVFTVALTQTDGTKKSFLWKIEPDEQIGVLDTIDWKVEDSTVTVTQGVLQAGWTVEVPDGAKVTVSGLPAGLKYKVDGWTGEGLISGTPTKTGNFVITFKTTLNGVTVVERIAMVVEPNKWTGTWYGVQTGKVDASLNAVITVAAGGTAKLIFSEGADEQIKKTTVTAKNIGADGKTVTFEDKKGEREVTVDFDRGTLEIDDEPAMEICAAMLSPDVAEVTTFVLEEVSGDETNAYAYVSATYNTKKGSFTLAGKLWDGTAVKGTTYALEKETASGGRCLAPVLLLSKNKTAVYLELSTDGRSCRVFEDGEPVSIGENGTTPLSGSFKTSDLKGLEFGEATDAETIRIAAVDNPISLDAKALASKISATGLVKLTVMDSEGWKWTCEMLPVDFARQLKFRGFATGTKKGESAQVCICETVDID